MASIFLDPERYDYYVVAKKNLRLDDFLFPSIQYFGFGCREFEGHRIDRIFDRIYCDQTTRLLK